MIGVRFSRGAGPAFIPLTLSVTVAMLLAGLMACVPKPSSAAAVEPPDGFLAYDIHGARLLIKTQTDCEKGSIFTIVRAGTGDQAPGETHCAHVAEHMVFRNPLGGSARSLADTVTGWQGLHNGWTGPDHTQYELSVPHHNIPEALTQLIQALFPASLDEPAFRQELEGRLKSELHYMTTNEIAAPLNALRLAMLAETVYDEQLFTVPVTRVSSEQVLSFMRREYSPQRLLFVVIANVDAVAVMDVVHNQLELIPQGESPESRLTELNPLPVQELRLPAVERPLVLVGLGVGAVPEDERPYLQLAYALLMDRLADSAPEGLEPDLQLRGALPVQGAACLLVGYRMPATIGAGEANELALGAMRHVSEELSRLTSAVTEQEVSGLLEAIGRPQELTELPPSIPASLIEAWRVGIATIPGTDADLPGFLSGAMASNVKSRIEDVLTRYADSVTTTAVVGRQAPTALKVWIWPLVAALVAVGALVWRRRHIAQR